MGGQLARGSVLALACVAAAPQACTVPHPSNPNHFLEGADLHYKLSRYYEGLGPPPLEEVFFTTQNLARATQDELHRECPGLLITAFIVLAEARLPVEPLQAASAMAKADELAGRLSPEDYEAAAASWPIEAALADYRKSAAEAAAAAAPLARAGGGQGQSLHVVVCHCRESLNWLTDGRYHLPAPGFAPVDLFVYEKCAAPDFHVAPADAGAFLAEFGVDATRFRSVAARAVQDGEVRRDECSAYLAHLVEHYEAPADFTMFFQADAGDHLQWEYLSLVARAIELGTLSAGFVHLNHPRLVGSLSPCREEVFRRVFGRLPKRTLGAYCCAQFVVSRTRIQASELARYQLMLKMLYDESPPECLDIEGHSTQCLMYEVFWHVLFGEEDDLPDRAANAALPLFLRIRDIENESYLPPGSSTFLQLVTAGS